MLHGCSPCPNTHHTHTHSGSGRKFSFQVPVWSAEFPGSPVTYLQHYDFVKQLCFLSISLHLDIAWRGNLEEYNPHKAMFIHPALPLLFLILWAYTELLIIINCLGFIFLSVDFMFTVCFPGYWQVNGVKKFLTCSVHSDMFDHGISRSKLENRGQRGPVQNLGCIIRWPQGISLSHCISVLILSLSKWTRFVSDINDIVRYVPNKATQELSVLL